MRNPHTKLASLWAGNEQEQDDKRNIYRTARNETPFTAISKDGDIFPRDFNVP